MQQKPVRAINLPGADGVIRPNPCTYHGFAMRETGAAAVATARIFDGVTAAGVLIDVVSLAISGADKQFYERGIECKHGIYVDVGGSGVIEGSIRVS